MHSAIAGILATSIFVGGGVATAANKNPGRASTSRISVENAREEPAGTQAHPDLWTAAKSGEVDSIRQHLAAGADVNQPDPELRVTPLSWAAVRGHTDAVKLLVENGADIHGRNGDGATPLHAAAFFGHAQTTEYLIEQGADVNAWTYTGQTPLGTVNADWGTTQFIAELLELDVEQKRIQAGRQKTAEVLRQHGANKGLFGGAVLFGIILFVVVLALAVGLIVAVVACVVLASALRALPEEHRQVEAWQVWLLMIPCFNVVWNFIVFPKVSRSYRSYFHSLGRTDVDGAYQLGFWTCVCSAANLLPGNLGAGLVSLVLLTIYLSKLNGYKNQILSGNIASPPDIQSPRTDDCASAPPRAPRRHDLDALRGLAMLAGIALHAALSFIPVPWPVQDGQQNEWFGVFISALHGFRMPLFFLLSGFFTAMLWRRRGLQALIRHRFRRIFLPCMLGLITIVPAVNSVSFLATTMAPEKLAKTRSDKWTSQKFTDIEREGESRREGAGVRGMAGGVGMLLMYFPFFHHLWFLWFLCWLVVAFAIYAAIADRWHWRGPPKWLVATPVRYLWLLPLTMIPQSFMGYLYPNFGPDTSTGIIPAPHILLYYAIFFGFGALYYDCDDQHARVGRWWPLTLPLGLLVIFPLGFEFTIGDFGFREQVDPSLHRLSANIFQVSYAWLMTFGCMGLCRKLLRGESRTMRYLSDSSYWLYIAHVPLIILVQMIVQTWQLPAIIKFILICGVVSGLLLAMYQSMVRYTPIGTLLNGPRTRPERANCLEGVRDLQSQ